MGGATPAPEAGAQRVSVPQRIYVPAFAVPSDADTQQKWS
jgi:hypothetical protein